MKGLSREPGDRRHLIVEVGGERLADEQVQSLHFHFVHQFAFDIGVAAGDQRCLHMLRRQSFQAEGDEFVFDGAPGEVPAFVDGEKLVFASKR